MQVHHDCIRVQRNEILIRQKPARGYRGHPQRVGNACRAVCIRDAWGRFSKSPMARATMCPPTHPTSPISTRSDTGGTTTT